MICPQGRRDVCGSWSGASQEETWPSMTQTTTRPESTPQEDRSVPEWTWGFLSATTLAIIGWFLTRLQKRVEKRDEQREAVAALRFELESNRAWLGDIFESRNYLRDEAWVMMKNKGFISYLPSPIPRTVIATYDQLHSLNERIRVLKEAAEGVEEFDAEKANAARTRLNGSIVGLIALMDRAYPEIGKNFGKP